MIGIWIGKGGSCGRNDRDWAIRTNLLSETTVSRMSVTIYLGENQTAAAGQDNLAIDMHELLVPYLKETELSVETMQCSKT